MRPLARFRSVLFWCHLATGVGVGLVVLVMSVTGVLLTYQRQLTAWADLRGLDGAPPSAGSPRLSTDSLVRAARQSVPDAPTAVTWRAGRDAPVEVAFGRERRVFVNAYTGAMLGEGSARARAFFRAVTDWHRWLGAGGEGDAAAERRKLGRSITGAANLGFLFLVVSGSYLWWPRNLTRRAIRNVALFRGGLAGKARDFNWHNVIGLWSAIPLFVIVLAGVVISYPWASDLVYRAAGEAPPARPAAAPAAAGAPTASGAPAADAAPRSLADVDRLLERAARRQPGWRTITMQLPRSDAAPVTFTLDAGTGGQPQRRAQLVLDRATGAEARWEPFASLTPGRRLRSVLRFAHTGEVLGLAGQTLAGLVSLGAVVLVWTGLALAWRRLRSSLAAGAQTRSAPQAPADRARDRAA